MRVACLWSTSIFFYREIFSVFLGKYLQLFYIEVTSVIPVVLGSLHLLSMYTRICNLEINLNCY